MKLIIACESDSASMNIRKNLLQEYEFTEKGGYLSFRDIALMTIKDMHIYHDLADKDFERATGIKPEFVVFISKHSSEKAIETITVHPIGNFDKATLGGRDFCVAPAEPFYMTETLSNMIGTGFRASFECTHHGPYLECPAFFAEIGSEENAWNDPEKGRAVAISLMKAFLSERKNCIEAMAIGGGHYMPAPTEIIARKTVCFGHMVPNYHLKNYAKAIEVISESNEVRCAYLDKKSIKKEGFDISEIRRELAKRDITEIDSRELPERQ
jgi:D-aminoacyl-tRNA deacylase